VNRRSPVLLAGLAARQVGLLGNGGHARRGRLHGKHPARYDKVYRALAVDGHALVAEGPEAAAFAP